MNIDPIHTVEITESKTRKLADLASGLIEDGFPMKDVEDCILAICKDWIITYAIMYKVTVKS
jgi:hypothetical protein